MPRLLSLGLRALHAVRCGARGGVRRPPQIELLQNTLDAIGEGLSVFDPQGRLAAHNLRFFELLVCRICRPVRRSARSCCFRRAAAISETSIRKPKAPAEWPSSFVMCRSSKSG